MKKTTEKQRVGHVARAECSRAKRSGADLSFSLSLSFCFSLSLTVCLSFSISQSVSLSLSLSLLVLSQIISRRLPPGFSCTVDQRRGDRPRRESTLLSGGFFFSNPERSIALARARPEERKLPGPNHASAAIFYLRRESGV